MMKRSFLSFALGACALLLVGVFVPRVVAAVTLNDFHATAVGRDVRVEWETATETGTLGFYVQGSTQDVGNYTRLSEFIPAENGGVGGALYVYTDANLDIGVTYYYKLEVINANQTTDFYGPVSATVGSATNTPTPTATGAATSTATATATATASATASASATATALPSATVSATTTRTPTVTGTPPTSTPTATGTPPTPTPTTTRTPTATSTRTPTRTATLPARTATSGTPTPSATVSPTPTETQTATPEPSTTPTATGTASETPTATPSATFPPNTATATPSRTPLPTLVPLPTEAPLFALPDFFGGGGAGGDGSRPTDALVLLLACVAGLLGVLFLGVGGYFIYQTQQTEKQKPAPRPPTSRKPPNAGTPSSY